MLARAWGSTVSLHARRSFISSSSQPPNFLKPPKNSFEPLLCFSFWMSQPEHEALLLESRSMQRVSVILRFKPRCLNQQDVFSNPGIQNDQYLTYMYMYVIILMYLEYIIFYSFCSRCVFKSFWWPRRRFPLIVAFPLLRATCTHLNVLD